jgi:hypothetical protein
MAQAIKDLLNQPEALNRYGKNGRKYVVENYSRDKLIRRYRELLHEVARGQMTDDRNQQSEGRKQRTRNRGQSS